MKIRTRVKIAGALAICVVLVYGAWSLYVNQTMRQMSLEVKEANQIIDRIFWLRALTYDFLSIPTERAQRQWSAVYEDLRRLLESPAFLKLQEAYGTADTPDKLINLGETFSKLLEIQKNQGHDNPARETQRELQRRLTTQLLLAAQDLATRIFKMTERINDELLATQQLESSLDNLALLALGLIIISIALVFKRSVVTPVLQLHDGVEIIGAGNLDYKVGLPTKDEIGELSQAFDRMTANLQMVTVSRDDLVREMAERQRAEAALRESREDLNRAQAVAHTGSWRMNVQKNQLTWSDENHRIFGIPPGTPMTYETFLGTVHPEDRESVDRKWMAALRGEPYDIEHRIMVDNMVKWVRERAGLEFDSEGQLIGGFGTTQDITERKRAEEALQESETKFRSLFESMSEGVVLHEMIYDESGRAVDYRILTTNSAFEKHTGLKTAQLQGQLASLAYGTGAAPYLETYARVANSCQPASFETFFPPLQRYFHISATAPKPGHFVTVFEDITERKQIEAGAPRTHCRVIQGRGRLGGKKRRAGALYLYDLSRPEKSAGDHQHLFGLPGKGYGERRYRPYRQGYAVHAHRSRQDGAVAGRTVGNVAHRPGGQSTGGGLPSRIWCRKLCTRWPVPLRRGGWRCR